MFKIRSSRKKRKRKSSNSNEQLLPVELTFNTITTEQEQLYTDSDTSASDEEQQVHDECVHPMFDDSDTDEDCASLMFPASPNQVRHVDIPLHSFFNDVARADPHTVNTSSANIIFLTAVAQAKQQYNLSNNAVSFLLRSCQYFNEDATFPLDWKHVINKLAVLKPYTFHGCALCGRYIFEKNDTECSVCNAERTERTVHYVPVMTWLKFLYANSLQFVERLMEIPSKYCFYSKLLLTITT